MAKPDTPWDIEEISPEARDAAKAAAGEAGMTVGQWINHTILNRASPREGDAPAKSAAAPPAGSGLTRSQHYLIIGLLAAVLMLAGAWFYAGPRAPFGTGDTADRRTPSPTAIPTAIPTPAPPTEPGTAPGVTQGTAVAPAVADRTAPRRTAPPTPLAQNGVAEIQRLLATLNFTPGPANGDPSGRTVAAIRLYQQFADLPVDGVPSRQLLDHLSKVVQAMKPTAGNAGH